MKIYLFGNGNIRFSDFRLFYEKPILQSLQLEDVSFVLCDFRGTDTLAMELLKTETANVTVFHVGEKPRYFPDLFKTKAGEWKRIGGFVDDAARDLACIECCTHFIATDFNSDLKRKSGTLKNIEHCLRAGKYRIEPV